LDVIVVVKVGECVWMVDLFLAIFCVGVGLSILTQLSEVFLLVMAKKMDKKCRADTSLMSLNKVSHHIIRTRREKIK
jgi:hypothetical protein